MAEHLPNNLKDWPDDPFALLGVVPPASESDLKRAYTRLIRLYKPEHHPDEFRKIREAYEIALRQIEWYRFFPSPESQSTSPPSAASPIIESSPEFPLETGKTSPADPEVPPRAVAGDPLDEAWKLAVDGERAEAYSRLVDLDQARPNLLDTAIRLYWLLTLDPGLDGERNRHDWLAGALVRSNLQGPAAELYRRELAACPEEALFGPYVEVLAAQEAPPQAVLGLARERLAASGSGGWWARIDGDLRTLSHRSSEFDDVAWLWYLVEAMGYVAFDDQGTIFERCRDLVCGLRHLELSQVWAFDRVDELRAMAAVWQHTSLIPSPVRKLIRGSWTGCTRLRREGLRLAASWVADDPAHSLYVLDQIAQASHLTAILGTLARIFEEFQPSQSSQLAPDIIRGLAAAFLKGVFRQDYGMMRPSLIKFLVEERIDPREFVLACSVDAKYMTRSLAEHVREDGVLWLVWKTATAETSS